MSPDFSPKTIDILAKRAAFYCSNPNCKVATVAPNSNSNKTVIIGEAAHIYGARPNSARFKHQMTDHARSEITNGVWLCRNCHKKVDRDETKYPPETLFKWREQHETSIENQLGKAPLLSNDHLSDSTFSILKGYPPIIKRIIIDKPVGWEFRLTAEFMRHFNTPYFRQLDDLRSGLYTRTT
ncbi:hypothetical protein [Kiloniella sp. EL199]|uniref:hypothetical protein n=1 Tax=Kiloniella sp. EL199 TaxID=2107581 RepID=UPI000EA203EE|nr:hypothetical protein [Kiloniella sp. EL199]